MSARSRLGPVLALLAVAAFMALPQASAYTVSGHVLDYYSLNPISGAQVTVYLNGTVVSQVTTGTSGNFSFDLAPGNYSIQVTAFDYQDYKQPLVVKNDTSIEIRLMPKKPANAGAGGGMDITFPLFAIGILFFIVIVVVLMFSRITGKRAIEHQRRSTLLDHIKSNPGTHFREMSRTFCMKEGSLTHHLSVLEREGFVKSKMFAGKKIYYLAGSTPMPKDFKEMIAELVTAKPGITQSDIARELEISRMLVHYHVDRLLKEEVIFTKENGLYPRPNLEN